MSESTQTLQADLCYVKRCSCVVFSIKQEEGFRHTWKFNTKSHLRYRCPEPFNFQQESDIFPIRLNFLSVQFAVLLAIIFILEIAAGALAYAYRGKVSLILYSSRLTNICRAPLLHDPTCTQIAPLNIWFTCRIDVKVNNSLQRRWHTYCMVHKNLSVCKIMEARCTAYAKRLSLKHVSNFIWGEHPQKACKYCKRRASTIWEQHFSILLNRLMVVKVLLECAIHFSILLVRIPKFLYANVSSICVRCTHLLRS